MAIHRKKQPWLYEKYLKDQISIGHPEDESTMKVTKAGDKQILYKLLSILKYIIPLALMAVGIALIV